MSEPFDLTKLSRLLRKLRRKHRLSVNRLSQATGISRRTLARIESGHYGPIHPERSRKAESKGSRRTLARIESGHFADRSKQSGDPACPEPSRRKRSPIGLSRRTAFKLVKLLLPREQFERTLADATRLSRSLGDDPLYKCLDVVYHYPAFLFHDSPGYRALREEFGADYRHSLDLLLRSGFGTRNLGRRLRAFRLQHDLTLVDTADLLGLSKSELHRLERAERHPSPRVRYRILRLLTLPLNESPVTSHESRLALLKSLLSLPPPDASTLRPFDSSVSPLDHLRHLWLTSQLPTKQLAAQLGISPSHLIRLLRADRRPSKGLRAKIESLTSAF